MPAASASIAQADALAAELARVSGSAAPTRASWVGQAGIRVGLRDEWVAAGASIPTWTDWDWAITTVSDQPYVLGRTARGLAAAVRRVVHALGYRCLAPGAAWEVLPTVGADVAFSTLHEGPSPLRWRYLTGIGSGCGLRGGALVEQADRLALWETRNGLGDDGTWDLGHAWGRIRNADPTLFAAHPEWLPGGASRSGNKLCVYEPGVQAEALAWALDRITIVGDLACVSMAAADGTVGWTAVCSGTNEQALHTPSDRQILLANYVQAALHTAGSPVRVAILAYGDMSAPPSPGVTLDPDVVVIVASQYMVDGQTPEQVLAAYVAAGAVDSGPYGYPSVWTQDFDEPGRSRATQRAELAVEAERSAAALGWTGEGSPSWAPHGRWYWSHVRQLHGED